MKNIAGSTLTNTSAVVDPMAVTIPKADPNQVSEENRTLSLLNSASVALMIAADLALTMFVGGLLRLWNEPQLVASGPSPSRSLSPYETNTALSEDVPLK